MGLLSRFLGRNEKPRNISVEEQVGILEALGFKPKAAGFIDYVCREWGRERVEAAPYDLLLFSLGGEHEVDGKWIPLSDDIYCFDTECVESDNAYEVCLKRLSVISKGMLDMANISSKINHEACAANVSFAYRNKVYDWEPVYDDDWFDCGIIYRINSLIKESGSNRFFYTMSADQHLCIVFASEVMISELNKLTQIPFKMHCL